MFKKYAKKALLVAPWIILLGLGVNFTAEALADWHYNEFIKPVVPTYQKLK